jgi:hypothetical protein
MEFNPELHHKVKYHGQLYVVILEEFPAYHTAGKEYEIVVHPICNDWIVHITNPDVRKGLTVKKGDGEAVDQTTIR